MRLLRRILLGLIVISVAAIASMWLLLRASLPQLDGELTAAGLSAAVTVERDELGTAIIRGANRGDVSFALGYVHGQERFLEMDLLRRRASGELSELLGSATLPADRSARVHRFRSRVSAFMATLSGYELQQLTRYADGVNAGLEALPVRPWAYLLLRQKPRPWQPEDGLLAPLAMYFTLQDAGNERELKLTQMRDALPPSVFAFLTAAGSEWDAPLMGEAHSDPALPDASEIDLRSVAIDAPALDSPPSSEGIGSNNFAVAGGFTKHGGAILANDMHLGLRVPSLWFRAELHFEDADGTRWTVTGVTLPGTPAVIAGSNRRIAWGFTNSYGDWSDFVELQIDPDDEQRYRGGDDWLAISEHLELIHVRGGDDETLTVRETVFGPIVGTSSAGAPLALAWTAHDGRGVNTGIGAMELAGDVDAAIRVAHGAGMPAQNLLVADSSGRIAWTLMGPIPRRAIDVDARFPLDRSAARSAWDGWLDPREVPVVRDPPDGRLWTANARTMDGDAARAIGDGGYTLGARARQIRDGLYARDRLSEAQLLAIQLDDRAVFLTRWQQLLSQLLAGRSDPQSQALRAALADWDGRASAQSRGYRLVRDFRLRVHRRFLQLFEQPLLADQSNWIWPTLPQLEGAVWSTLTQRPPHLLPKNYANWDEWLLAGATDVLTNLEASGIDLDQASWGALNTTAIRHPLSAALPGLSRFLDMPAEALDGDQYMPRVQGPRFGASERLVVSPGREDQGYFHMPGGQSGHPLSPFYGSGHDDWARGRPSPFLPGPAVHNLVLKP